MRQPLTGLVLDTPQRLPDFSLRDHAGRTVGRELFQGQWDLVLFGFTHCPDICPWTLQMLSSARKRLLNRSDAPPPRIVLVSVDPERDTPELLARYLSYFDAGIIGLTGDVDEVRKLANGLGVYFEKAAYGDEDYSVEHAATVLLIGPDAELKAQFRPPHEAASFVRDLPLIIGGS